MVSPAMGAAMMYEGVLKSKVSNDAISERELLGKIRQQRSIPRFPLYILEPFAWPWDAQ